MKHLLSSEQSATLIAKGISAGKASAAVIYLNYADEEVEPDKVFKREDGVLLTRLRSGMTDGVTAKMVFKEPNSRYSVSIFTLADIYALLPKEIEVDFPNADGGIDTEDCYLCTQWSINGDYADNHQWGVFYTPGFQVVGDFCAKELIDGLYKCLIWAIDHNHVKLD